MIATRSLDTTPISYGLDFERAREVLAARYGEAFHARRAAKAAGQPSDALLDRLRAIEAQRRALRVDDSATIASILDGTLHPPLPR
jgi:hypothetical protein